MSEPKIRLSQISPSATGTDSISGNVTISNDLTVGGNLVVSGNTTTLNVETLLIEDNELILNSNVASTPTLNAQITVNRGSSSNTFLLWDESADKWGWSDDGNNVTQFANALLKTGDTMTGELNVANNLVITGNVGIANTTPQHKLDVNVNKNSSNLLTDADLYVLGLKNANTSANVAVGLTFGHGGFNYTNYIGSIRTGTGDNPTGDLVFGGRASDGTAFVEIMRLRGNTSSVGIGTTPVNGRLTIDRGSANFGLRIDDATAGSGSRAYANFTNTSDTDLQLIVSEVGAATKFALIQSSVSQRALILNGTNSGNVGIGTLSPAVQLHLEQSGAAGVFTEMFRVRAGSDNNDTGSAIGIFQKDNSRGLIIRAGRGSGDQAKADFILNKSGLAIPSATQDTVMTLLQGGNVGIGETSPKAKLDVNGAIAVKYSGSSLADKESGIICQQGTTLSTAFGFVINGGFHFQGDTSEANLNFGVRLKTADGSRGAIAFNVNSSTGYMTNVYQVGFQATRGTGVADQALGSDITVLEFNQTYYNIGSAYNTSTYRFTAPVAGRYLFAVTARLDALTAGSYARVGLSINGSTDSFRYAMSISGNNHSTDYETQTVSAILNLAAGDYVQAYGGRSGGGGGLQFESQFSGILLA